MQLLPAINAFEEETGFGEKSFTSVHVSDFPLKVKRTQRMLVILKVSEQLVAVLVHPPA